MLAFPLFAGSSREREREDNAHGPSPDRLHGIDPPGSLDSVRRFRIALDHRGALVKNPCRRALSNPPFEADAAKWYVAALDLLRDQANPEQGFLVFVQQFHLPVGIRLQGARDAADEIGANLGHIAPGLVVILEIK